MFVFAQGAEHAAAEARAVARDNARAEPLFISGAAGANAAAINGVLEPTEEQGVDGRVLYRKRGDGSVCMEHFGGKWQVKLVSSTGTASCYAYVAGGCAAEACTSRQWTIGDGQSWTDAPLVKMVAEAEVCSCCMPSSAFLTSNLPPAASPPTDTRSQSEGCR